MVAIREVVPRERLVFAWGSGSHESTTVVTVTFADQDGSTRLAIRQTVASAYERVMTTRLDRLAVLLHGSA